MSSEELKVAKEKALVCSLKFSLQSIFSKIGYDCDILTENGLLAVDKREVVLAARDEDRGVHWQEQGAYQGGGYGLYKFPASSGMRRDRYRVGSVADPGDL